jgi:hypothetical protein
VLAQLTSARQTEAEAQLTQRPSGLGPGVQVTREAHLLAGDRHCTYRIRLAA